MTLDAFFAALQETPRLWIVTEDEEIRFGGFGGHCPLSYVAATNPCDFAEAVVRLGLDWYQGEQIADAADLRERHPVIRGRLLAACGLQEGS
jgi:hypothetical protein